MPDLQPPPSRPWGIAALAVFFGLGAGISLICFFALLFPGGFLEPIWRLNPKARDSFATVGPWALLLMAAVCAACACASRWLWSGERRGYRLALGLLVFSALGDLANALLGVEPRAWVGVPVAAVMIGYLATRGARAFFAAAQP
jgi:hypothetical protein